MMKDAVKKAVCLFLLFALLIPGVISCADITEHGAAGPDSRQENGSAMPSDFSFSLVWGTYGISSYDSATGRLIKTKDATDVSKYTTTLRLDEEKMSEIFSILEKLELETYPDVYDPMNDPDSETKVYSEPNQTIILKVHSGDISKTVTCEKIAYGKGYNDKARDFISAVRRITEIITAADEWKALPEYEFFYD